MTADDMNGRRYDPAFAELVPSLPTVTNWTTPEEFPAQREQFRRNYVISLDPIPEVRRRDETIAGVEPGEHVRLRVYVPTAESSDPRPAILEIHGGGFVLGSLEMMDGWCDHTARALDAVIVSVDYRLAPEHPYPAAFHDCIAALQWLADSVDQLGVDPDRIAVAGQSAGGALAAAVAQWARDTGGPAICFQLLEIPVLDDRLDTVSMRDFVDTPNWNRPNAEVSWSWYLGADNPAPGSPEVPPWAAPARAGDLSGLPPAYVSVMEFDPLRDEGIAYATRLLEAGVSTELHAFAGTFHGCRTVSNAPIVKKINRSAREALAAGIGVTIRAR